MNWQNFSSHRRLYVTVSLERLDNQVSGQVTRAHFAPQAVKLLRTVPGCNGVLTGVGSGQAELTDVLQQLEESGHHPLRRGSFGESWTSDTKATSSLITIEILQNNRDKLEKSGIQGNSLINISDSIWPKKNLWPPIETHGKELTMAFPYRVNIPEEKTQSLPLQSHRDLLKDTIIGDRNMSPSRGPKVSQYPEPDFLQEHVLKGRKIKPKKKKLLQATLPIYRLERRHEEIQSSKQEKMKNKRTNSLEAWMQFFPEQSFLEQNPRNLGPLFMEGASLLHKKKTQVLGLSSKDHHSKSGPRARRQNLQPLAQDDIDRETIGKLSKMERRKLRMEWWDPTVWGDPVTLIEREHIPRKTCFEVHTNQKKLSFPTGRSIDKDTTPMG